MSSTGNTNGAPTLATIGKAWDAWNGVGGDVHRALAEKNLDEAARLARELADSLAELAPGRGAMTNVTLSREQYKTLFRAVLEDAKQEAANAAEKFGELWEGDIRDHIPLDDARTAAKLMRESLDALDALAWPSQDEQR
jgi:sugar-specific transcriptional regulator TrmB